MREFARRGTVQLYNCLMAAVKWSAVMLGVILPVIDPGAAAQNALDAGGDRALDASLRVGSGGRNTAAAQDDMRNRNLLVTGDAASGRGFRGSVGYSAAEDFRGMVGGDALSGFRAGSAQSDPLYLLSMQTGDPYAFGSATALAGVRRDYSATTAPGLRLWGDDLSSRTMTDARIRLDRAVGALSTSNQLAHGTEVHRYGATRGTDGAVYHLVAGSLRGVSMVNAADQIENMGVGTAEAARMRDAFRASKLSGVAFMSPYPQPFAATGRTVDGRLNPADAAAPGSAARWNAEYAAIIGGMRDQYGKRRVVGAPASPEAALPAPAAGPQVAVAESDLAAWMSSLRDRLAMDADAKNIAASGKAESAPASGGGARLGSTLTPEEEVLLLRHGKRIARLDAQNADRSEQIMAMAAQQMAKGRPFEAERLFALAAGIGGGNPMASIGLANAQVAAGLSLAAGLTLRRTFRNNPELIDARYDQPLVASDELQHATATSAARAAERSPGDAASYGLVIAYIGHQVGDAELVSQGLALMAGEAHDQELVKLLDAIWRPAAGASAPQP